MTPCTRTSPTSYGPASTRTPTSPAAATAATTAASGRPPAPPWTSATPSSAASPPATATHIARHDPARVLREVAAKRRILARHAPGPAGACRHDRNRWPCADVRDLLPPYADHPDFHPRWIRA
ncbi:DUF6221 family protein [Kitasatospora sp. NPDC058162]|uniref:DUF6221 family protein n=1 Tax=Kitasatospora sp. NPDC058162 TaxID=3346362 RepID=UPI0036D8FD7D